MLKKDLLDARVILTELQDLDMCMRRLSGPVSDNPKVIDPETTVKTSERDARNAVLNCLGFLGNGTMEFMLRLQGATDSIQLAIEAVVTSKSVYVKPSQSEIDAIVAAVPAQG